MVCTKCGNEIKNGDMFCTKCGNQISNNTEQIVNEMHNHSNSNAVNKNKKIIICISIFIIFILILVFIVKIKLNNRALSLEDISENTVSSSITDKTTKEDFRLDDTSETGATYNFNLNDVQVALDKVCDKIGITRSTKFINTNSNNYNTVYESYLDENNTTDCIFIVQVHNNYVTSLSYQYSNENINFNEDIIKNVFFSTLQELFNKEYIDPIIKALKELPNNKFMYDNYTLCIKYYVAQYKTTQYEINASSPEFAERSKASNPELFDIENNSQETIEQEIQEINSSNIENLYNKIYEGMSYREVINILGEPTHTSNDGYKTCTWFQNEIAIMIKFSNDKVLVKAINGIKDEETKVSSSNNSNNDKYAQEIPNILYKTEEEAINILKSYGIQYEIKYDEYLSAADKTVYDYEVKKKDNTIDKNQPYVDIGESLVIYVNKYNNRTIEFEIDTTQIIADYVIKCKEENLNINSNQFAIDLKVNNKTIFSKTMSNAEAKGMMGIDFEIKDISRDDTKRHINYDVKNLTTKYTGYGIINVQLSINGIILQDFQCNSYDTYTIDYHIKNNKQPVTSYANFSYAGPDYPTIVYITGSFGNGGMG